MNEQEERDSRGDSRRMDREGSDIARDYKTESLVSRNNERTGGMDNIHLGTRTPLWDISSVVQHNTDCKC